MRYCIFFASLLLPFILHAKTYKVYFLGGQSNMDGYGYVRDLPSDLNNPIEDVMIFHGNTSPDGAEVDGRGMWTQLRPGHGVGFKANGKTNTYSNRFGLELTFAKHLKELEPDIPIALVKYSRGGTSIDIDAAAQFGCWDPDYDKENGINQYDHFLACMRAALSTKDIDGDGEEDTLIPAGILWMQGESDAHVAEIAQKYESHLKRLMDLIRASLWTDDVPVVIGRISDSGKDDDGKVWNSGEVVRQAQTDFVTKDVAAALVTSTDNYGYSDKWHYNSAGYIDLGKQFAEKVHALHEGKK